jgi:prephenate dehydrogenase
MDAVEHDRVIAATIGVPHVLAFAAAGNLDRAARHPVLRGRSWASLTRVSVSDTGMVAGFLHGNAAHQLGAVAGLRKALQRVERALRAPSKRPLKRLLARWQSRRR